MTYQEEKIEQVLATIRAYLNNRVGRVVETINFDDVRELQQIVDEMLKLKYPLSEPIQAAFGRSEDGHLFSVSVPKKPKMEASDAEFQAYFDKGNTVAHTMSSTVSELLRMMEMLMGHIRQKAIARRANDDRRLEILAIADSPSAAINILAGLDDEPKLDAETKISIRATLTGMYFPDVITTRQSDLDQKLTDLENNSDISGDIEGDVWKSLSSAYAEYGRDLFQKQITRFNTITNKRRQARKAAKI